MKFVPKNTQVIEAHQWHKNGDHPLDYSKTHSGLDKGVLRDYTPEERKENNWEGDVVRYFRHPSVEGSSRCTICSLAMHVHGWIDGPLGGYTVCPGNWVVTRPLDGTFYTKTDAEMKARYLELK